MGKLKEWVGSALLAQPFYVEELRMIGLLAPALRLGLIGKSTSEIKDTQS